MKDKENLIESLKVMESASKIQKRMFETVDELEDIHRNMIRNYIALMKITLEEFENGTRE